VKRISGIVAASALLLWAVCSIPGPSRAAAEPEVRAPVELPRDVYVMVAFVDGVPAEVFDRALRRGDLPNIDKLLVQRGCKVKKATSLFPTVTFSTQPSSVTGLYPGHFSVPGLKWLKRDRGSCRHHISFDFWRFDDDLALYSPKLAALERLMTRPETTFSRLCGHCTASVQQVMGRDAERRKFFMTKLCAGKVFTRLPHRTDCEIGRYLKRLYADPRSRPRFSLVCFPDFDAVAHMKGADSEEAREVLRRIDRILAEIAGVMVEGGIFDRSYIVLVADHGNTPVGKSNVTNYQNVLKHAGLKPRRRNEVEFDSYVASNSLNSVAIYVSDPARRWRAQPAYRTLRNYPLRNTGRNIDLIQLLARQKGSDFLIVGDGPGRVRVMTMESELVISRRTFLGESYYQVRQEEGTQDPWQYLKIPELAELIRSGRFASGREWQMASRESLYPDAVAQSVQVFDSFRCGDIFVSLRPGWKCRASRYVSTHGSMRHTDMHVPLIIAGPDIQKREISVARLADIYPTTLRLFGLSVPFGVLDGRPLDEILPEELVAEQDPNRALRAELLPAMRQLWELEAASAARPVLPHQFRDTLKKTPRTLRVRLANLLRLRRQRLAHRLDEPQFEGILQPRQQAAEDLLRTREQELSRQIRWLDGVWTGDSPATGPGSASGTQ